MVSARSVRFALVATLAVLLGACGGGGKADNSAGTPFEGALGAPGNPAEATRTVELRAGDNLRFMPDGLAVKVGETITFKIVNVASITHDFTLGDQSFQDQHEEEMRSMASGAAMDMKDEPTVRHIAPGETKELTWTFSRAGTTLYGCHEPGHYASGMKGSIAVT